MHANKSLLLIDDDRDLSFLLKEYLTPQGYEITQAFDGESGLQMATSEQHFDLILLDVMLPAIDGFEVLKKLRATKNTPVLMLTAKGDDFDRIFGLELGADDYLPKPFNHRELSARIKAIVRRMEYLPSNSVQHDIQIEDVHLQPGTRNVSCSQQSISLTSTEFSILQLLMMNCSKLVSKNDISEKVLGRKLATYDRSIDMHVSNIRKKLHSANPNEKIKTVRGSGYIFLGGAA